MIGRWRDQVRRENAVVGLLVGFLPVIQEDEGVSIRAANAIGSHDHVGKNHIGDVVSIDASRLATWFSSIGR